MAPEDDRRSPEPSEPVQPMPLPPELAAFLTDQGPFACVPHATDLGTAYVLKAPAAEIASARGIVPVHIRHELYDHRSAPVIRTVLTILDRPEQALRFESFSNVALADQRADFAALAGQKQLVLLFYDEALQHRLNKRVPIDQLAEVRRILAAADELQARIPAWRYDFDRAVRPVPPKPV